MLDLEGDDDRLQRLSDAAEELSSTIKGAPQRTAVFTMVAIDANVPADEPILGEVGSLLEKQWRTYAGAFANEKLPVVARAIVLEALARAISSEVVAVATCLTARTFLPLIGSPGDQHLWADIIEDAEKRLEAKARREWALPSSTASQSVALTAPTVGDLTAPALKREFISERVAAAVGPTDAAGASIASGNPHWPNEGSPWSAQFTPRATKAIGESIDAISKLIIDRVNAQSATQALVDAISTYVGEIGANFAQTSIGLERRTSLLWWKEALFSTSIRQSYREIVPVLATGWVAVDALEIAGPYTPLMLEAFLGETIHGVDASARQKHLASELFTTISQDQSAAGQALRQALKLVGLGAGRSPLAGLLAHQVSVDREFFEKRLGLPMDLKLSLVDLCVWLFRDMQAARATEAKKRKAK
jgi:hypothetical protein